MEGFQISYVCPLGQVHKSGHAILYAQTFALAFEHGHIQFLVSIKITIMKKKNLLLSVMTILMVVVAGICVTSCGSDDDENGGLNLSESQIRNYLESGTGTWSVIKIGDEGGYSSTWYFRNGKTNGWGGSNFSMWGTPYTINGNLVYITKEDADNYRGDVLEGGIVITNLTDRTLEFYRKDDSSDRYIGTKN